MRGNILLVKCSRYSAKDWGGGGGGGGGGGEEGYYVIGQLLY